MRKYLAFVLILAGCGTRSPEPTRPEPSKPDRYEVAMRDAAWNNRKVFILFAMPDNANCKKLDATLTNRRVVERLNAYTVVHMNTLEDRAACQRFGVTHVPCYFVVDPTGQQLASGRGFKSVDEFLRWLP